MKALRFSHLLSALLLLAVLTTASLGQQSAGAPPEPRGLVVEVMYYKGSNLAYQAVGGWTWYGAFQRSAGWKPRANETGIEAVKITSRLDAGVVKARVTVLRGRNMDIEDFVADHAVSPGQKTIVRELLDVGIEPFELQLVRAPTTVAEPPALVNNTKSLQVSLEPNQSSLPSFVGRFLNNSSKPIASFSFFTSVDGRTVFSAAPRNQTGPVLIKPGETYQQTFRYAMRPSTVSTGEVPRAQANLVFNLTSVVFTDGTYEGDALPAAHFLVVKLAEKTQIQSFLDRVRSKGFTNSESELQAAMTSVSEEDIAAEIVRKFPSLTAEQKAQLRDMVDFGKNLGVKFIRTVAAEPPASLAERLQQRIEALP